MSPITLPALSLTGESSKSQYVMPVRDAGIFEWLINIGNRFSRVTNTSEYLLVLGIWKQRGSDFSDQLGGCVPSGSGMVSFTSTKLKFGSR